LAILIAATHLCAQRYTFRQYGSTDGLSNLGINCVLQDRAGYIWAGTDNGLFRYDGQRFRFFGDAEGLPSPEIRGLAESPDGVLWVATRQGIARQAGELFKAIDVGSPARIQSVAFDRLGRMYLEQLSGIIVGKPDGAGSYRFTTAISGPIHGLFVKGEDVWFGEGDDLWLLTGGRTERIGSSAGLPVDQWNAVAQDSSGNLWARSATRLYELAAGQKRFLDRSEGIPHTLICRLYPDSHGRLFVSTDSGAVMLEGNRRVYIDSVHGLPDGSAGPILLDREGSLWLGVTGGSLIRLYGHGEWQSWKKEDGLLHNSVFSVLHDRFGQLWVGTIRGLSIFGASGKLAHTWTSRNGLAGDLVTAIAETPADVFIGTYPGGVSRFNKSGMLVRNYGAKSGLSATLVLAIKVDRQGWLWVVGKGGCFRSRASLNDRQELRFDRLDIPGLPESTEFRDALVDESGVVWIATSHGLVRFDGGHWRVFTKDDGLKSEMLNAIAARQGAIWISYRNAPGITRLGLDGVRVETTQITKRDGLSSDLVYALAFDHEGRLWASTDNGVNRLEQGHWRHFGTEDGLIWDDCDVRALFVDRDDKVWVGTSGGLSRFAPAPYPIPNSPPPIVLTSIKGGSQEFQAEDHPALPHAQNSMLIRFSGLNYSYQDHIRFRYRLLGYENSWSDTREGDVHYAGLPAGKYIFEVMAAGPDSDWSPAPAHFAFSVEPPWWLTWWFLISCLAAVLLSARAVWRFRAMRFLAQKQLLEQQVADRTAELIEIHHQLEEIAYHDLLTSLPNRRMFTNEFRARIKLARRNGEPFSLLLIDLDNFKQINDTLGHDVGDSVLIEIAIRLRRAIRESDCAARLGGDEFAILLTSDHDMASIEVVCRRIIDASVAGIQIKGATVKTTCSVGIARFPEDGHTQDGLLKSADIALYQAKQSGRSTFCWHRPAIVS
jgi:diguanylate cyclase (GGDEF)-like protein